ncbi:MAG: DUF4301 family protein [Bacteroidales bacterium]|nr:DUF4301 family protein [Bacteroidales bacterium]
MQLTSTQVSQLQALGILPEDIEKQLEFFREGFPFARLVRPATINDGIIKPSEKDLDEWIKLYEDSQTRLNIVKFVPASGAASRMFKGLFEYLNSKQPNNDTEALLQNMEKFPFYADLYQCFARNGKELTAYFNLLGLQEIVEMLLLEHGLGYGLKPKGLLKFHRYLDGERTAVEEHLVEAFLHARGRDGVKIHFTVSPEHENLFLTEFTKLKQKYNNEKFELTYSFQKLSTNTIAVDENNEPVIEPDGTFVFRPAGHGALLENLNNISADLIFIKNIDNIAPDHRKILSVRYKKALGGLALKIKNQITDFLTYLEWHDNYTQKRKHEIAEFMNLFLGIKVPEDIDNSIFAGYVKSKLDKPIRICGMVKNTGEPGGGPFWVLNRKGEPTLQIIESSQVNFSDFEQKAIFSRATHFNPVDMVCITNDFAGNKFNLLKYRDDKSGFISEKTHRGKKIKIQELPGLWNGGMAHWITIFVEIPIETFTPVKTFTDWLRDEHQNIP